MAQNGGGKAQNDEWEMAQNDKKSLLHNIDHMVYKQN